MKSHLAFVVFPYGGRKVTFLNAFVPSDPSRRKDYFPLLDYNCLVLIDFGGLVCLAGDFNCTFQPSLDRNGVEPHPESAKHLAAVLIKYHLINACRL